INDNLNNKLNKCVKVRVETMEMYKQIINLEGKMEIIQLPIEFDFNGHKNYIYPSLVLLKDELTLVDTGYPNFIGLIESEIIRTGYNAKNLKNIIVTHYDDDHIGSLYDFKEKYPWVNRCMARFLYLLLCKDFVFENVEIFRRKCKV